MVIKQILKSKNFHLGNLCLVILFMSLQYDSSIAINLFIFLHFDLTFSFFFNHFYILLYSLVFNLTEPERLLYGIRQDPDIHHIQELNCKF